MWRMFSLLSFTVLVICISADEDIYENKSSEESANGYYEKQSSVKCYQCAYTPSKTEVEKIKVPKVIKETVSVPKIIETESKVPRMVWESVKRPRVIYEEYHYYDEPSWQWKIGTRSKQVFEVVWVSRKVYERKTITKQVTDKEVRTKKVYDVKTVKKTKAGGWDKCLGPFTQRQAKDYGVDEWDCDSNCYIRLDKNGNVLRGCYKDEFGVDPQRLGCHEQAGYTYCFCKDTRCNSGEIPKLDKQLY